MAKLFNSWRTDPAAYPPVVSAQISNRPVLSHSDLVKRLRGRVASLETDDLITFIEGNIGDMGRDLRNWRAQRDDTWLNEMLLVAETQHHAVEELVRRSPLPGFGLSAGG